MGHPTPLTHWDWIPQRVTRILDAAMGTALPPLRAEMFGNERFAQHGRSLGDTHRAAKAQFGQATFYPRLRNNIRTLRAAHQYILEQADSGQDLSPAAQWLVDNFHLIEAQLREIHDGLPSRYYKALPVLQDEPLVGLPRVYGVAWAFVAHTDSVFDGELLVHFLSAYQERRELTQGEMWALPTTLRVVLIENLRRLADRVAAFKAARELANLCADRVDVLAVASVQDLLATLNLRGVGQVFLAQLAQSLQGRRPAPDDSALARMREWLAQAMPDVQAVQAQHNADQVADNLSVGNAVNSLRLVGSVDWSDIVARSSLVMRVMLTSPVFLAEDDVTRDQTLHAIERLSHQTSQGEAWVAQQLLAHMAHASGGQALAWHWLSGPGRPAFETQLGVRSGPARTWRAVWALSRVPGYLMTLLLVTAAAVAWLLWQGSAAQAENWTWPGVVWVALAAVALCLPASEAVVALLNRLISESVRPVHLPRFALDHGIPPTERVLVVIPAMLSDDATTHQLLHSLLLHHLASNEPHAQFALLTDWPDAPAAQAQGDDDRLATAREGIEHLNSNHPATADGAPRFLLLHRARQYSPTQQVWMGWERKRGKLEQLVATLATGQPSPFLDLGATSHLSPGTRHVLTLDSDTHLPPGQLRALVAVAAHPQNQPVLDASGRCVVSGYGILQPRITAPLTDTATDAARATPYHWLMTGQQGMDPYSAMASDVYQDLFGEGSFTGKGLINVAALHTVLNGRLPAEQVLSHDLLEGALVRCAVVSDVTLVEPEPSQADVARSRLHRWTRGDWQLLPFLLRTGPWPMAAINRWKMWDNLRRSLVAPASVWLLVSSCLGVGLTPAVALAVVWAAYTAGPLMGAVAGLVPVRADFAWRRYYLAAATDLCRTGLGGLWHTSQLLQQAVSNVDAIGTHAVPPDRQPQAFDGMDHCSQPAAPGHRRLARVDSTHTHRPCTGGSRAAGLHARVATHQPLSRGAAGRVAAGTCGVGTGQHPFTAHGHTRPHARTGHLLAPPGARHLAPVRACGRCQQPPFAPRQPANLAQRHGGCPHIAHQHRPVPAERSLRPLIRLAGHAGHAGPPGRDAGHIDAPAASPGAFFELVRHPNPATPAPALCVYRGQRQPQLAPAGSGTGLQGTGRPPV
jgi:cyclic beta-1,2-glucan synthetase